LIVDDEPTILFALEDYFAAYGFQVRSAASVEDGLTALGAARFDAMVADLRLGVSDRVGGLRLVAYAAERCLLPAIVMLSAYATDDIVSEAERLGAHAFVRKPVALLELAILVEDLCRRARTDAPASAARELTDA
jgi:DNA-binding NtrC family response regulator